MARNTFTNRRKPFIGLGQVATSTPSTVNGILVAVISGALADTQVPNPTTGLETLTTQVYQGIDLSTTLSSNPSATAFHPTIWDDFEISATPTYNFYVSDETVDSVGDPSASLDSIPRYVTVRWDAVPPAREYVVAVKTIRPADPRIPIPPPPFPVTVAKNAAANGFISPGAVAAVVVPPMRVAAPPVFSEELFLASPSAAGLSATSQPDSGSDYHVQSTPVGQTRTFANFVDPSIAGAISPQRVAVAVDPVHLVTLGALAKLAPSLEVISEFNQDAPIKNPPPSVVAPGAPLGVRYTGYVLERYTLDASGSMTLSKTVDLDDPEQDVYVDRDVAYGTTYSYRIRAMVQWCRTPAIGFFGPVLTDIYPVMDVSQNGPAMLASYYLGTWSDKVSAVVVDTATPQCPDELTVRPSSPDGRVYVAWKMPQDTYQDLRALRLLRASATGGKYTDWTQVGEFVPANGQYVDLDVGPFERTHTTYVYAMYSVTFHGNCSNLTEKVEARLGLPKRVPGEFPLRLIGPAGDDPFAMMVGPTTPEPPELRALESATFFVRDGSSGLPLTTKSYVVEVQSLATGQKVDLPLTVTATDVEVGP